MDIHTFFNLMFYVVCGLIAAFFIRTADKNSPKGQSSMSVIRYILLIVGTYCFFVVYSYIFASFIFWPLYLLDIVDYVTSTPPHSILFLLFIVSIFIGYKTMKIMIVVKEKVKQKKKENNTFEA